MKMRDQDEKSRLTKISNLFQYSYFYLLLFLLKHYTFCIMAFVGASCLILLSMINAAKL